MKKTIVCDRKNLDVLLENISDYMILKEYNNIQCMILSNLNINL